MFENDLNIMGKHATYIKFLVNEAKLYKRYIDVYMNAAIFGLLYNRVGTKDSVSQDRARIYADAFANCRDDCVFIYRLVMLIEESSKINSEERIDRTFRYDADSNHADELDKNLEMFHSYVLGGIEIMYEKLTEDCLTQDDYITRAYELLTSFSEEIEGHPYKEKLASLISA